MEPDCYKIDVLHFLNPHLIWVQVINNAPVYSEEYFFEQIGVYGLLPLNTDIDIEVKGFKSQRCTEWIPAASTIMKKFFAEAEEIWFSPTHIDKRTSIFDNNIHKYGDIVIKRPSGKLKTLSKVLDNSGFAFHDEPLFHQELSLGNLKTKLSNLQMQDVVKKLKMCCKQKNKTKDKWVGSVINQTSVLHTAENLEALTVKNIERHNEICKKNMTENIIQKKLRDLSLCKDIDDEPIGRAIKTSKKDHTSKPQLNTLLRMKLDHNNLSNMKILERKKQKHVTDKIDKSQNLSPFQILQATRKYLERKAFYRDQDKIKVETKPLLQENTDVNENNIQETSENSGGKQLSEKSFPFENESALIPAEKIIHNNTEQTQDNNYPIATTTTNKSDYYDMQTEKFLAFGPPGFDKKKLLPKVVPKEEKALPRPVKLQDDEGIKKVDNLYADVDSEVNLTILNKAKLLLDYEELYNNIGNVEVMQKGTIHSANKMSDPSDSGNTDITLKPRSSILQKKLRIHKELQSKVNSSFSSESDTSPSSIILKGKTRNVVCKEFSEVDSDDDIDEIINKLELNNTIQSPKKNNTEIKKFSIQSVSKDKKKNFVNPFKNLDSNISVFVEKVVSPVLMVHTKMNKRIQPCLNLRDVNFNSHIRKALKAMKIVQPMTVQKVSWFTILRGYSLFMISPVNSGKTMGYIPAICRLISDCDIEVVDSVGPTCIIVCATAESVSHVEKSCQMFLGIELKIFSCYAGKDELNITTSLLNGCDLFICTPCSLVRLLQQTDFGVDLRRLSTFVLEDCERLAEVYSNEIKFLLFKIKEMLNNRVNKELNVQYILASRLWCDFMEPLAKKVPNTVICIGAFQECVLYSRASTAVNFVKAENKLHTFLDFINTIDKSKKTVVVCGSNEEVIILEKVLKSRNHIVFACDSTMSVQDLQYLNKTWNDYVEPVTGPILVCRDDNLSHMNVTDAHHLLHYSMPQLFSTFCKRFSVLNENYPSIFKTDSDIVKIKILLEDSNLEQLPKILNFIKRCTNDIPKVLDDISERILAEKDAMNAKNLVPVCDNLLAFGQCSDYWNCKKRHSILKEWDEPKEWVPRNGVITLKILHYQTAALYSARLLSNTEAGVTKNYSQTYSTLSLKMGMYFSKDSNRRLHGIPKIGDVCAVSLKNNFFVRCQVVKIINYHEKGKPHYILIKIIDEEIWETARDTDLYHLPDNLKTIETNVVQVRLANIQPKDRDITYSNIARDQLKVITEKDEALYLRGQIVMTVSNCIFVDNLEACQDLSSVNKTVVMHNFKQLLLESHAIPNLDHIPSIQKMCEETGLKIVRKKNEITKPIENIIKFKPVWAHLDESDCSSVFFASAENPGKFFVRLVKFDTCIDVLIKDIQKYVSEENITSVEPKEGDIVLAKFPDDDTYERARIEQILDDKKVKCFFVDQGDWREVLTQYVVEIPDKFITRMSFQAIECRLIGVKPVGNEWTDYSTNWFYDNCFEDEKGNLKHLYVKYFLKEKAECTGGHRYAVVIIDTNTENDIVINTLLIETYLAEEKDDEIEYLNEIKLTKEEVEKSDDEGDLDKGMEIIPINGNKVEYDHDVTIQSLLLKQPIKSVPLVASDDEISDDSRWDGNMSEDFMSMFKPSNSDTKFDSNFKKQLTIAAKDTTIDVSSHSDYEIIPSPLKSIKELDSDDMTSPDPSLTSDRTPFKILIEPLDDTLRKPKLLWRQNKQSVTLKIQLIGVDNYNLDIKERSLKFSAEVNNTKYGFDFDMYGVLNTAKCQHSNKGQYILVKLIKVLQRNWLYLTKDNSSKKWIVYDMDSIDTSSDEEAEMESSFKNVIPTRFDDSDSDDDDFRDDVNFHYTR